MTPKEMRDTLSDITYKDGYVAYLKQDPKEKRFYVQVHFTRPDTYTGTPGEGKSGKRYVSEHMCKSEFVQMVFGTFLGLEEHECREAFMYKGRRVFGPHIDVEALWEAADKIEVR
jgi:hypothetical protein